MGEGNSSRETKLQKWNKIFAGGFVVVIIALIGFSQDWFFHNEDEITQSTQYYQLEENNKAQATQVALLQEISEKQAGVISATNGATATVLIIDIENLSSTLQVLSTVPPDSTTSSPNSIASPTFTKTARGIISLTPRERILSSFDGTNLESWTASFSNLSNPGRGGNTTASDNDGHLRAENQGDNRTSYYIAPKLFHRDWRIYSTLRIDMWSSEGKDITSQKDGTWGMHGDIYIESNDFIARRFLPHRPSSTWEIFYIPLYDDGLWILGPGTMTIEDALSNVTKFEIRAEYGEGDDFSGIDNVELIP